MYTCQFLNIFTPYTGIFYKIHVYSLCPIITMSLRSEYKNLTRALKLAVSSSEGTTNDSFLLTYLKTVSKKMDTFNPTSTKYVDYLDQKTKRDQPPKRYAMMANGGFVEIPPNFVPTLIVPASTINTRVPTTAQKNGKRKRTDNECETGTGNNADGNNTGPRKSKKTQNNDNPSKKPKKGNA